MLRRASWFGSMKSGVACVLLSTVAASFYSPAQAECVAQPNRLAPEGAHWSLFYDTVNNNRRCWMLVDATGRDISTSQAQQAASPALSPLQTFFINITGIQPPAPPQPQEVAPSVSLNPPRRPQAHLANANRPDHHARTEQKSDGHATKRELTKPERDALFQDFLRWHESQQITGAALPASRRQ